MNWYLEVLKKYAVFSGRARRKEYWFFALFNTIVYILFGVLAGVMGQDSASIVGILIFIYALGVLLPAIGVTIRRLHDIDKSGWWILVSFVPFIGGIVLFIFTVLPGTPGPNNFGEDPIQ